MRTDPIPNAAAFALAAAAFAMAIPADAAQDIVNATGACNGALPPDIEINIVTGAYVPPS